MDARLLSVRQVSALTGLTPTQVRYALRRGRISSKYAQWVDGRWVIREDFKILHSGMEKDPMLASLPEEFISEEPTKDYTAELPEAVRHGNVEALKEMRSLPLPGFERVVGDLGVNEIYRLTGVHPATQQRIKDGKKVRAKVALRLAYGLGEPVEELLK